MLQIRHKKLCALILILLIAPLSSFNNEHLESISLRMEKRSLHKGRATVTVADIYFQSEKGRLIKNYIKPEGKITIINRKGELAIYNKENNTSYFEHYPDYNTEDNILFFILSAEISVNGANEMGFKLKNNEVADNKIITRWMPPPFMKHLFSLVEITYEDQLPHLATYYDENEKILVKVYFTDFETYQELTIPATLTEFIYVNENDSIINRVKFTDVQINEKPNIELFDLELPDNAM